MAGPSGKHPVSVGESWIPIDCPSRAIDCIFKPLGIGYSRLIGADEGWRASTRRTSGKRNDHGHDRERCEK
jgi:hypothetical protein